MPNHVTNELKAPKRILDAIAGDKTAIDFSKIVPMPEIMQGDSANPMIEDWARFALGLVKVTDLNQRHENPADSFSRGDYGAASNALHQSNIIRMLTEGPFPKDFSESDFETLVRYMRALKQYGHANWYDWSRVNWGTKWNAYNTNRVDEVTVRFDTAWSAPIPVIDALSKRYPEVEFRLRWADEDTGSNTGDIAVKNGEVVKGDRIEDQSPEAYDLYLELRHDGVMPEEMKRTDDGKLVYVDDDSTH